jgi:hypothetical protein
MAADEILSCDPSNAESCRGISNLQLIPFFQVLKNHDLGFRLEKTFFFFLCCHHLFVRVNNSPHQQHHPIIFQK